MFSGWWLSAHPQTYQPVGEHNPKPKRGWWLTYPSEKWWSESQLGWWNSQLNGKIIHMFQTTNQYIYIYNQPVKHMLKHVCLSQRMTSCLSPACTTATRQAKCSCGLQGGGNLREPMVVVTVLTNGGFLVIGNFMSLLLPNVPISGKFLGVHQENLAFKNMCKWHFMLEVLPVWRIFEKIA